MCLEHFLNNLDSLPQLLTTKVNQVAGSGENSTSDSLPVPSRKQPSRRAKKPTNFYELENPETLKRERSEDGDEQEADNDRRPCKRRRDAIRSTNYGINLDGTNTSQRPQEIIWAAKRLLRRGTDIHCCFSDNPVVCSACELRNLKALPESSEQPELCQEGEQTELVGRPTSPTNKTRIIPTGRLASSAPDKKRIKLVGRLAPSAIMKPSKVTMAAPPRWNPTKGVRPFMLVRFRGHEFAVDFCKDLLFVPMASVATTDQNAKVKLFGYRKH
jgi:hypothetical protein